jgi:hypothetical protein
MGERTKVVIECVDALVPRAQDRIRVLHNLERRVEAEVRS